ncbi:hypothetical protein AYL99_09404 [Fonsecaea erecta]|uniref:RBR-type E3 ubiquitin transferase n=1 Tax=Fonsecaea erecta TaxID=1367422 RepID=A0A178ZAV7_9EURO|nr:hypothetical protein AYL99_09404 [Fonsecaea erecta]OAP56225.1 hypothetical protein AYL99_09404 [Fonsecaea erecta]
MSEVRRARHLEGEQQNEYEQGRKHAMDLTEDIRKDRPEPLEGIRPMQAAEDDTDFPNQEEMEAMFESVRRLRDKLDLEADSVVRQKTARQITAQEERKETSNMQAEDERRLEEDFLLARALSEIENEMEVALEWNTSQLPTRPRRRCREPNPFRWFKRALRLAVNHLPAPSSDRTGHASRTPGKEMSPAADLGTLSTSLNMARNLQRTWRQETHKHEGVTRHAQEEAGSRERRTRRGVERHRREGGKPIQAEQMGQEEPRRTRLASTAKCSACIELLPTHQMCRLECEHYYCRPCLETAIQTAVKEKRAFRCCSKQAEPDVVGRWLPARMYNAYTAVVEELSTPDPTYCHSWLCSAFIPTAHYVGDTARCPRCSSVTCRLCKQKAHGRVVCEQDAAGQALLGLSETRKWMRCPHCKTMVERYSGCLHMTCRCGTQFCYNCGRYRWLCRGSRCMRR